MYVLKKEINLHINGNIITVLLSSNSDGEIVGEITTDFHSVDDDEYNLMIDGLESLILAHACAGVNIESRQYVVGITDALNAISNKN